MAGFPLLLLSAFVVGGNLQPQRAPEVEGRALDARPESRAEAAEKALDYQRDALNSAVAGENEAKAQLATVRRETLEEALRRIRSVADRAYLPDEAWRDIRKALSIAYDSVLALASSEGGNNG